MLRCKNPVLLTVKLVQALQIPLEPAIREGCDEGVPVVISNPDSTVSKAYVDVAQKVVKRLEELSKTGQARPEIHL